MYREWFGEYWYQCLGVKGQEGFAVKILFRGINLICVNIQIQELMVENNDMRETLKSMQAELIKLLNQQNEDYESNTEVGI